MTRDSLFDGTPTKWTLHRKNLENIIWSNEWDPRNAAKLVKLSTTKNAIHMIDNVDVQQFLTNPTEETPKRYLDALEVLFVSTSGKELCRIKFTQSRQEPDEVLTLLNARCKTLFRLAYPARSQFTEQDEALKDQFINGIYSKEQKRYILEQKNIDDDLNKLLQLGLKYESVQLLLNPKVEITGFNIWRDPDEKTEKRRNTNNVGANNISAITDESGYRNKFVNRQSRGDRQGQSQQYGGRNANNYRQRNFV